jgi:trigger factor
MQANLTHHTSTRKSIQVTVPAAEVSEEFGKVLAKLAPKAKIPGFRPGKAPKDVLLARFEREIQAEVTENLVNKHFWNAATTAGAQPISRPALEKVELREGQDGSFNALFDVAPEVKLADYKGMPVLKQKRLIDDAAVEEHLEGLRQKAAKFIPVEEPAAEGFYGTFDIKVKPQGLKAQEFKDQVIQLAGERAFDKEVIGMKVDERRKFTISIPEDDANRAMAGKPVVYEVLCKDLRKREVPELNDEFAKDMGNYETLQGVKDFIRKDLEEAAERDAVSRAQSNMLDELLDKTPFEVPSSMTALQLDDFCQEFANAVARQGMDPRKVNWSAYRQSRMRDAEKAVRSGYLLQAIGNAENIEVSDEEIEADVRKFMEENDIKKSFQVVKEDLEKRGALNEFKGRLRTDKIFDRLFTFSKITEELLDKAAFEALLEAERKKEAGTPTARFDAGGVEGGDFEAQEGGEPTAVVAAEEHVHGPDCDHDHEPVQEEKAAKPKRTTKKKDAAAE